jgi:long-subunit fatty acid transport protein
VNARVLLIALLAPATAAAEPLDTFGFGARATGMAGATTADTRGAAAAHANPAAVAHAPHPEVTIGWGYGRLDLELDGRGAGLLDPHGADIGLAIPLTTAGVRHGFGLALYLPDQFIARIQLIPATEPHFVFLDNDPHRVVVEPVYSVQLAPWLSVGAGVSLLADAAGNGITFNVGVKGGEKVGESSLDVALPTRVAPMAGVLVTPHPRVRIGASWRGELDLGLKLDILANVDVAGVVTGDALISLRAVNYFTPHRVNAGVAVDVTDDFTLTAELMWQHWAAFEGGVPDLKVLVALGITPPLVDTFFPADDFHDTFSPRVGAEWLLHAGPADVALRAGYAHEASPVPEQTGLTSFADNDRHVVAVGAGMTLRAFEPVLTRPISFDVGLQWHHLRSRLTIKDQDMFPGRTFSSGGDIFRAAGTMTVQF